MRKYVLVLATTAAILGGAIAANAQAASTVVPLHTSKSTFEMNSES